MGILKKDVKFIIKQGRDFGKKFVIESVDSKYVYYKEKDKQKKINILHVFPLE